MVVGGTDVGGAEVGGGEVGGGGAELSPSARFTSVTVRRERDKASTHSRQQGQVWDTNSSISPRRCRC